MYAAEIDKAHVRKFCAEKVKVGEPFTVRSTPIPGEAQDDCFGVVERQVAREGGERVIGWSIWEWPGILIEAEYHAIWRSPSGELIDLSPRPIPCEAITFIEDAGRPYDGLAVDNIRKPLVFDHDVLALIEFMKERFAVMNSPRRAREYGAVRWTRAEVSALERIERGIEEASVAIGARYGMTPLPGAAA
ncbi:hypothetical protein [Paracidovorax wautersii]|uniref:hypothetical protein n=1 Tax=Paracidovorax wautersii TaxID=1177982 RepID=UPI0031D4E1A2